MREQGYRTAAQSKKKREEELRNKDAEQLLRVRRKKKSLGNIDAKHLFIVRKDKKS